MEKAEMERQFFLQMTKRFLIINVMLCVLEAILEGILFILFHFIFLALFDIFFLVTIFLSIRDNIEHLLKKLILFFVEYKFFSVLSLIIFKTATPIALNKPLHYIFLLFNTILVYIAALFSKKKHNFITILILFFSFFISLHMIGWIFYVMFVRMFYWH